MQRFICLIVLFLALSVLQGKQEATRTEATECVCKQGEANCNCPFLAQECECSEGEEHCKCPFMAQACECKAGEANCQCPFLAQECTCEEGEEHCKCPLMAQEDRIGQKKKVILELLRK